MPGDLSDTRVGLRSAGSPRAIATRSGRVRSARRRQDVMTAAAAGLSQQEIADQLSATYEERGEKGISTASIARIITRELDAVERSIAGDVERIKAAEIVRIDRALRKLAPKIEAGELAAIKRMEGLVDLKMKVIGGYAPTKHEHSGSVGLGIDPEQVARMEEAWRTSQPEPAIEGSAVEIGAGDG